ncbi:tail fiber domain-containing protein [Aeromicrobium piscarium]|uniref:Tail fiber domain-containing protein n=1 Tax=Aeromicrobium piscarium TaxID=2590901 RepID=A0A554SP58_9ACTN|nr:tail fiber domain-containing protein [Aeromicrobium piscarium]TSD68141.1 tail fiber domain-containing protein [Aeromicrobium piscarium]
MDSEDPWKRIKPILDRLQREVAELRSTTRALGATAISRGDLTVDQGGNIIIVDGGGLSIADGGGIRVTDSGAIIVSGQGSLEARDGSAIRARYPNGQAAMVFGRLTPEDLYDMGLLLRSPEGEAKMWFARMADETFAFTSVAERNVIGNDSSALTSLRGQEVRLSTPQLSLYELPTTSSAANLHLGTVGGKWTVAYISSSRRYKRDIADLAIDPDAVKRWRPRTWRDKADVDAVGDNAAHHIGYIAEEIADAGTPELVVHDAEGQIDGLAYDRMTVGLHALAMQQEQRIVDLEAENAVLRDRLAAIEARLGMDSEED